jgi:hypothetical protein
LFVSFFAVVLTLIGCAEIEDFDRGENSTTRPIDTSVTSDLDPGTDEDPGTETEHNTGNGTGQTTDTGKDTGTGAGTDTGKDTGTGTGQTTDTESDTDSDTHEVECPWNSGYPCPCNQPNCSDSAPCITYGSSTPFYGTCAKFCSGSDDMTSCANSDFGIQQYNGGACLFDMEGTTDPDLCALVCGYDGKTGSCPDSLFCMDPMGSGLALCLPRPMEDEETGDGTCTVNSRYPCPCTGLVCNDGSECLSLDGLDSYCARSCNGATDISTCDGVKGYGLQGVCNITETSGGEPVFCSLACEYDGVTGGGCPSGLQCTEVSTGSPLKLCM